MTNIAIIVLDTLRKDTFDEHFDWMIGERFDNAWSTSHWTVPAHASLFTGRYASDAGVHARAQHLDWEGKVLAERLARAGYRTRAFSTNSHITPYFDFDRGFDHFECRQRANLHDDRLLRLSEEFQGTRTQYPKQALETLIKVARGEFDIGPSVKKMYRHLYNEYPILPSVSETSAGEALSYVRETEFGTDEFLFMNLMDVHGPYKPPVRYQRRYYSGDDVADRGMATFSDNPGNGDAARDAYEDCARYLSDILKKILDELDDFDYVITLSDHGESFGEDGVWAHIYGLNPVLTQVPLVVRGPERTTTRHETPVDLLDVYATIMDVAGLDPDPNTAGRSLREEIPIRPCLTEYHGITHADKVKKIGQYGLSDAEVAAYDEPRFGLALPPNYYRHETLNEVSVIGKTDYDDPAGLLEELKAERPELDRTERELGEDVKSQLSQLGYL
jgi:arylsulfatase